MRPWSRCPHGFVLAERDTRIRTGRTASNVEALAELHALEAAGLLGSQSKRQVADALSWGRGRLARSIDAWRAEGLFDEGFGEEGLPTWWTTSGPFPNQAGPKSDHESRVIPGASDDQRTTSPHLRTGVDSLTRASSSEESREEEKVEARLRGLHTKLSAALPSDGSRWTPGKLPVWQKLQKAFGWQKLEAYVEWVCTSNHGSAVFKREKNRWDNVMRPKHIQHWLSVKDDDGSAQQRDPMERGRRVLAAVQSRFNRDAYPPRFHSDPKKDSVIRLTFESIGGWNAFWNMTPREQSFRFPEAFAAALTHQPSEASDG
jgi:hypothetical protein